MTHSLRHEVSSSEPTKHPDLRLEFNNNTQLNTGDGGISIQIQVGGS